MTVSGKGGRPRKPTALRVLHGDRKDRINATEPVPPAAGADPPEWLGAAAARVWHDLAPDLRTRNVLTAWDVEAFACWCDAVARRRKAAAELEREGELTVLPVFDRNGKPTGQRVAKNPWLAVLNEADAQVQRIGARFGLTPADRSALSSERHPRRDPTDDLLTG